MSQHASNGPAAEELEQRVLLLAPFGRDGALLSNVLKQGGMSSQACTSMQEMCREIRRGAGAVLVADEALSANGMEELAQVIGEQPPWSDLPLFVMMQSGQLGGRHRLPQLHPLGNVTMLERPLRAETIISSFRMGLRARAHQYQLRSHLEAEREAANALRESESRYRTLAEALPQLVWTCKPDGDCDYLGRQWAEYTGIPDADKFRMDLVRSVIYPEDLPLTEAAWKAAIVEGTTYDIEYRIRRHDGVYRWFKVCGTPLRGADGSIQKWFGTCTDIEEQKRAFEERQNLYKREQRARASAELLNELGPGLLMELDTQRLSQKVTDLATELSEAPFGALYRMMPEEQGTEFSLQALSGGEDLEKHPFANLHSLPHFSAEAYPIRSGDIAHDARFEGHVVEGVRSYFAAPIMARSSQVAGWMVFGSPEVEAFSEHHEKLVSGIAAQAAIALDNARLFAEAQRAQEILQRSNRQLRRANEDLNQFAYSASHDLQEPLRMVAIYSQMLQRKYQGKLDEEANEYIGYTVQGSRRMEMLLKDLLDYTQVVDGVDEQNEPVDAGKVLGRALENLAGVIRETDATITASDLPQIKVKEVHLLQLFQNLIGNALKYRSATPPMITISACREGKMWRLNVQDNGIGIDQQYALQVFGLFKRLHGGSSQYEGTGIGLAICQKIVERNGGRIWVESEGEGKGSTFCFTLPSADEPDGRKKSRGTRAVKL